MKDMIGISHAERADPVLEHRAGPDPKQETNLRARGYPLPYPILDPAQPAGGAVRWTTPTSSPATSLARHHQPRGLLERAGRALRSNSRREPAARPRVRLV